MQVTLVSTTETLDVVRKLPDGTTEEVGSYQVAISDPAFVAKAEELVREIGERGLADACYDYGDLTEKSTGLVRSALGSDAAQELLGDAPDVFNSLLLLTAIMKLVNELDPGRQMMEQINALLPDGAQLSAEMLASQGA
ncbi:hypothetical protein [Gordonibacter urolithinfaciens]|uniref:hypothetical protein n=1 Tax=Gordonibacter urolithinfaciens TaxID=1335613 RepID=UPI000F4BEA98|nr:hypothetical protein [Gordonibacter urolithinfaciens]ROT90970.1 hypothetical protein DMP13_07440 [Gordonibacter urolithinfaciens]